MRLWHIVVSLLLLASSATAQTRLNPDISAIGDFRLFSHTDEFRSEQYERLNFAEPNLELDISGYLNPYSRADVAIGWHDGENAEIEEVYFTILRGLPLDVQLRGGKMLLPFGRLNPSHEHTWPFIKRPLPHELYFGEEGLSDVAVLGSVLLPTGNTYTELSAGVLSGEALRGHEHGEEHEEEDEDRQRLGVFGRLTVSVAAGESAELAVGVSALYSVAEESEKRATIAGLDVKYKSMSGSVSATVIQLEALLRFHEVMVYQQDVFGIRPVPESINDDFGFYFYVDHKFARRHTVGLIAEATSRKGWAPFGTLFREDLRRITERRIGVFTSFLPVEETFVSRLAVHWTDREFGAGFWEGTLQFVIGLGPHKIHSF